MSSLKRHEGFLEIDHRASPGIPAEIARRIGLDPRFVGEGKRLEAATICCNHCGGGFLKNPDRKRPRYYCRTCDHYLCDGCKAESLMPGYVHQTKEQRLNAAMSKSLIVL